MAGMPAVGPCQEDVEWVGTNSDTSVIMTSSSLLFRPYIFICGELVCGLCQLRILFNILAVSCTQ